MSQQIAAREDGTGRQRRLRRRYVVGGAAVALGTAMISMPSAAHAAEATHAAKAEPAAPYYCGAAGSGWAYNYDSGYGFHPHLATDFAKQPAGCHDFNLVETSNTSSQSWDKYLGWYLDGSNWVEGSEGWVSVPDFTGGDWVLLSDVATGTAMKVWDWSAVEWIWVNY
jgi:hypothetical protein